MMRAANKELSESRFNEFYREYFSQVSRYIYRLIGNSEESEQLTQQAFTSLYGYLLSKSSIKNTKALLFRIATNGCFNYLRTKKKSKEVLNKVSVIAYPQDDPLQETIKNQRKELIQEGLAQLHPRDRLCILLYLEGLSYSEIADVIKTNKTTIGKTLLRAIERLAHQIKSGDKL